MLHPFYHQQIVKEIDPITGTETLKPLPVSEDKSPEDFKVIRYSQHKNYTLVTWQRGEISGQTLYRGFEIIGHGGGTLPLYQQAKPNTENSRTPLPWTGTVESRIEGSIGMFGIPLNTAIALSDSKNSRRI